MKKYCFYLPQFHPIPENNKWWGDGFTEWTNVTKCKPRFSRHHQPHLPTSTGFYDLRLAEARQKQVDLAKEYNIDGFIYYHYWFNGKRLLNTPIDETLKLEKPDFPFALCWANESWSRAWDGQDHQLLIEQTYNKEDHKSHACFLSDIFSDERYIKVGNRPLFLVYRLKKMKFPDVFLENLEKSCIRKGIAKPFICGVKSSLHKKSDNEIFLKYCDAVIDFQPNSDDFPLGETFYSKLIPIIKKILPIEIYYKLRGIGYGSLIIDYQTFIQKKIKTPSTNFNGIPLLPCAFPSWDNSPRRKTSVIIQNLDPENFKAWLFSIKNSLETLPTHQQIIFINAWNEWAEGCHLEPDQKIGCGFLEAVNEVFPSAQQSKS